MKNYWVSPDAAKSLNLLAREQLKLKLLQDIRFDLQVCQLEGWDYRPYLEELKEIIDGFIMTRSEEDGPSRG